MTFAADINSFAHRLFIIKSLNAISFMHSPGYQVMKCQERMPSTQGADASLAFLPGHLIKEIVS